MWETVLSSLVLQCTSNIKATSRIRDDICERCVILRKQRSVVVVTLKLESSRSLDQWQRAGTIYIPSY